jgi:hypothetical protein
MCSEIDNFDKLKYTSCNNGFESFTVAIMTYGISVSQMTMDMFHLS